MWASSERKHSKIAVADEATSSASSAPFLLNWFSHFQSSRVWGIRHLNIDFACVRACKAVFSRDPAPERSPGHHRRFGAHSPLALRPFGSLLTCRSVSFIPLYTAGGAGRERVSFFHFCPRIHCEPCLSACPALSSPLRPVFSLPNAPTEMDRPAGQPLHRALDQHPLPLPPLNQQLHRPALAPARVCPPPHPRA